MLLNDLIPNVVILRSILIICILSSFRNDSRILSNFVVKGQGNAYISDHDRFLELFNTCSKKSLAPYNVHNTSTLRISFFGV